MASVRYIVADMDKVVEFYRDNLDFKVDMHNPGKYQPKAVIDRPSGKGRVP